MASLLLSGCGSDVGSSGTAAGSAQPVRSTAASPARPADSAAPSIGAPVTVVSLSPQASRFVLALGAGAQLVAVDAASAELPALANVARTDLSGAAALAPGVVLTGGLQPDDAAQVERLRAAGVKVIELAPHDLEDVAAAIREVGSLLVGHVRAMRFETEFTRPLAEIGGSSFGQPRPRTLAVVGFEPIVAAGGHSFETDLVEIAGGQSVTHPGEDVRRTLSPDALGALAPQLVVVMTPEPMTADARRAALAALPEDAAVEFFEFEGEGFWLDDAAEPARRLRAIIERYSSELPPVR